MGQRRGRAKRTRVGRRWVPRGAPRGAPTHVLARGEFLEVSHGGLHLVLMVADRRGRRRRRAGGDAPERRISRRWRHPGRRHGQWAPSCEINVQMVRYPDCRTPLTAGCPLGPHWLARKDRGRGLDRVKSAKRNLADRSSAPHFTSRHARRTCRARSRHRSLERTRSHRSRARIAVQARRFPAPRPHLRVKIRHTNR